MNTEQFNTININLQHMHSLSVQPQRLTHLLDITVEYGVWGSLHCQHCLVCKLGNAPQVLVSDCQSGRGGVKGIAQHSEGVFQND